eukprot:1161549-Pelagomonas_calceolata.AAC.6
MGRPFQPPASSSPPSESLCSRSCPPSPSSSSSSASPALLASSSAVEAPPCVCVCERACPCEVHSEVPKNPILSSGVQQERGALQCVQEPGLFFLLTQHYLDVALQFVGKLLTKAWAAWILLAADNLGIAGNNKKHERAQAQGWLKDSDSWRVAALPPKIASQQTPG